MHRVERYQPTHEMHKVNPAFPCFFGVVPIGEPGRIDGHKYACGLFDIRHAPIVYSLGSNLRQEFEAALLVLRPDAKIFIFEIDPGHMVPQNLRHPQVTYYNIGLGYDKKNPLLKTLKECMDMHGHKYIDILKMDIEGAEYAFITNEIEVIPRVGQLLIEMHVRRDFVKHPQAGDYIPFVEQLEAKGLGLFYKEHNVQYAGAAEFSFIQRDWVQWEASKGSLA